VFGVETPVVAAALVIALATFGLVVGAMYLRGGTAAIRRQLPQIAVLGAILVVGAVGVPIATSALTGGAVLLILLPLSVGVLWARARRSGEGRPDRLTPSARPRALRALIIAWLAVIVVSTIWLAVASSGGR
jgi:hypothetical protein